MNFFNTLIRDRKLKILIILIIFSLFCITLFIFRSLYSSTRTYIFLIWNLFLAWVPFGISSLLLVFNKKIKSRIIFLLIVFCWLLFFPNAPYILTDLFHLKQRHNIPLWYDLNLILSFAINGLFLGLLSLQDIQELITNRFNKIISWFFVFTSLLLASFGIYIGRFLRWNSWDVIYNTSDVIKDIKERLINPEIHPGTYGMTITLFIFLSLIYMLIRSMIKLKKRDSN